MVAWVSATEASFADLPARLEGGTPNVAGAIGMAAAAGFIDQVGRDRIDAFNKADRQDLVDIEEAEMKVLQVYLPARLSADEVAAEVKAIVAELGASGPGDMGKVMGAVKQRLAGKADMGAVSAAVKAALAG